MASARTPRSNWIDAGLRALATGGPDAVRIELLAQGLGVTKGGFYGYFADRRSLLVEMLSVWETRAVDEPIEQADRGGDDERLRLRRLFALAAGNDEKMDVELAIRDWARRDDDPAACIRRVDDRRMEYLRTLFAGFCDDADDVEARALIAFSLFIGNHFIMAGHGSRTRAEVIALVLERLAR